MRRRRVLAVASGGGHWVQLLRLRPAFVDCDLTFVTVKPDYATEVSGLNFHVVPDATRWDRWKLLRMAVQTAWIVLRVRPDVVITTGAAPGVIALRMGKWLGARTIWLDSVANVESMSLSGQRVRGFADLWLTQWEHLADPDGPNFFGAVL